MAKMRAAFLTGHGGNEVVCIGEREIPQRRAGEVLVRVVASGLNRVDLYMRNSGAGIRHNLPLIMGLDCAGTVEDADDNSGLAKGEPVVLHPGIGCGVCEFCIRGDTVLCTRMAIIGEHRDGSLADFISLPQSNVFPMPAGLSFAQAASLSVGHLTAWRMLHTQGQAKPWETVLIFGIGGTVSLAALQLAKLSGMRVIVTSRHDHKLAQARQLGADAVINGATEDVVARVQDLTDGRGVDMVIENVGAAVWSDALKSLVRGGRIVVCGATTGGAPSADLNRIFIRQLRVIGSTSGTLADFANMLTAVGRSGIKPVIDSTYDLADLHAALDRLDQGAQLGKISISVAENE